MCGIAGILFGGAGQRSVDPSQLDRFRSALAHRGPDGSGVWTSRDRRAGLTHTRLAIIDLSDAGAQPMHSPDGRYHLVLNGEIYNHEDLRKELVSAGHHFVGHSDTEVLLHLLVDKGIDCLSLLDGMFAFALYDERDHTLTCARDPLGEKPLYIFESSGCFAFASEVRALVAAGISSGTPDMRGLGFLLRQGSIPPPLTHVEDVRLLGPGTWIKVDADARVAATKRYWTIPFVTEARAVCDREVALDTVAAALHESVRRRARADVPVGAFLSGGIDSAAVCAFLVDCGVRDLQTFTVTLPGQALDEGDAARATAQHLGTKHTEIPLEVDAGGEWLDEAIAAMDVPSIDGPNTWLVSRAVRQTGIKVACSGLGGDELFFGYPSFSVVPRVARWTRALAPLRRWREPMRRVMARSPAMRRSSRATDALLAGGSLAAVWFAKRGVYSESEVRELLTDAAYGSASSLDPIARIEALGCPKDIDPGRQVSFYELSVYMHDQLLRDSDCMSMAHALEVRLPLVAPSLVATVASLSASVLLGPRPKSLLRDVLLRRLPASIMDRTKRGFTLNWSEIYKSRPAPADGGDAAPFKPKTLARHYAGLQRETGVPPVFLVEAWSAAARR